MLMVQQTTPSERQQFYARFVDGQTYEQIADEHGRSVECVRYWCRRQRDGQPCVTQQQRSTKDALSRFSPLVRYAVLRLRLQHPRWGPHSIHLALTKRPARDLTADNLTDIWLWPFGQVAQQLPLPFDSWRG
jgi:hypothetical protein